jgi:hypothetical protein
VFTRILASKTSRADESEGALQGTTDQEVELGSHGELWHCRFDGDRNVIVVNSGHRDFVFATRNRALQLRYLVRLYVKELMLENFAGAPADQLHERMIELSLYAEEKLKPG